MPRFNQNARVVDSRRGGGAAHRRSRRRWRHRRADGPALRLRARADREGAAARCSSCRRRSATSSNSGIVGSTSGSPARGELSHLKTFPWPPEDLRELILSQDAICVSGGNTANMLAIWRVHGIDALMREAWENGVVLWGASAGMICWFEHGVTDSFGPQLDAMDCLGFLPGSACPHYDGEAQRRPRYRELVDDGLRGRDRRRRRRRAALRRHGARRGRDVPAGRRRLSRRRAPAKTRSRRAQLVERRQVARVVVVGLHRDAHHPAVRSSRRPAPRSGVARTAAA